MQMNCIAIDDEPLALNIIEKYTEKVPFLNLVEKFQNPVEAVSRISKGDIDLILLDIQMPELTGLELAGLLNKKPMIIFTTAYPSFAIDSYEHDAIDYLLKPIAFNRFLKAINKAKENMVSPEIGPRELANYIFVKSEYKTVKIDLNEVLFIESLKDYVIFHFNDKKISSLLSLTSVEEQLPKNKFTRVHRSFIVALNKIDSLERNLIHVGDKTVNVSDSYREIFQSKIEGMKLK